MFKKGDLVVSKYGEIIEISFIDYNTNKFDGYKVNEKQRYPNMFYQSIALSSVIAYEEYQLKKKRNYKINEFLN